MYTSRMQHKLSKMGNYNKVLDWANKIRIFCGNMFKNTLFRPKLQSLLSQLPI